MNGCTTEVISTGVSRKGYQFYDSVFSPPYRFSNRLQ